MMTQRCAYVNYNGVRCNASFKPRHGTKPTTHCYTHRRNTLPLHRCKYVSKQGELCDRLYRINKGPYHPHCSRHRKSTTNTKCTHEGCTRYTHNSNGMCYKHTTYNHGRPPKSESSDSLDELFGEMFTEPPSDDVKNAG